MMLMMTKTRKFTLKWFEVVEMSSFFVDFLTYFLQLKLSFGFTYDNEVAVLLTVQEISV